ncbi:alpha/beta hydrolase [Yinghuangia seranimata]|uniref:alpha/beta hydrolase n=1 Tax=Yinghuangia seranimata TaxID=408067 RepID=UPI00248BD847|nr:alpha/beta hydrolase [Yinghuangia seranimata]MDI2128571.1 alpha/beta hydrolase [Yinghuangia seranimata]
MPELSVPVARALVRHGLRPVLHPQVPVAVQRAWLEMNAQAQPLPPGSHVLRRSPGGVPARRVSVGPRVPSRVMLYLHGGGYVVGSSRAYLSWTAHLARAAHATVYSLDYRRAPEHPYPAALDDARAAWCALSADTPADTPMVLAGDSAGGGLALSVALEQASSGGRRPDALVLVSPWLDPLRAWPYEPIYHRDPVLRTAWLTRCAGRYAGGADREELAPACFADLSGLPTTIVQNGTDDILAPQGAAFAERAREFGVTVEHTEYPDLWHDFQVLAGRLPAADEALHDLAKSLDAALPR